MKKLNTIKIASNSLKQARPLLKGDKNLMEVTAKFKNKPYNFVTITKSVGPSIQTEQLILGGKVYNTIAPRREYASIYRGFRMIKEVIKTTKKKFIDTFKEECYNIINGTGASLSLKREYNKILLTARLNYKRKGRYLKKKYLGKKNRKIRKKPKIIRNLVRKILPIQLPQLNVIPKGELGFPKLMQSGNIITRRLMIQVNEITKIFYQQNISKYINKYRYYRKQARLMGVNTKIGRAHNAVTKKNLLHEQQILRYYRLSTISKLNSSQISAAIARYFKTYLPVLDALDEAAKSDAEEAKRYGTQTPFSSHKLLAKWNHSRDKLPINSITGITYPKVAHIEHDDVSEHYSGGLSVEPLRSFNYARAVNRFEPRDAKQDYGTPSYQNKARNTSGYGKPHQTLQQAYDKEKRRYKRDYASRRFLSTLQGAPSLDHPYPIIIGVGIIVFTATFCKLEDTLPEGELYDKIIPRILLVLPVVSTIYSYGLGLSLPNVLLILIGTHTLVTMLGLTILALNRSWLLRSLNITMMAIDKEPTPIFYIDAGIALAYFYTFGGALLLLRFLALGQSRDLSFLFQWEALPFLVLLATYLPVLFYLAQKIASLKEALWQRVTTLAESGILYTVQNRKMLKMLEKFHKFCFTTITAQVYIKDYLSERYPIIRKVHPILRFNVKHSYFYLLLIALAEVLYTKHLHVFYFVSFIYITTKILNYIRYSTGRLFWGLLCCKSDYIYRNFSSPYLPQEFWWYFERAEDTFGFEHDTYSEAEIRLAGEMRNFFSKKITAKRYSPVNHSDYVKYAQKVCSRVTRKTFGSTCTPLLFVSANFNHRNIGIRYVHTSSASAVIKGAKAIISAGATSVSRSPSALVLRPSLGLQKTESLDNLQKITAYLVASPKTTLFHNGLPVTVETWEDAFTLLLISWKFYDKIQALHVIGGPCYLNLPPNSLIRQVVRKLIEENTPQAFMALSNARQITPRAFDPVKDKGYVHSYGNAEPDVVYPAIERSNEQKRILAPFRDHGSDLKDKKQVGCGKSKILVGDDLDYAKRMVHFRDHLIYECHFPIPLVEEVCNKLLDAHMNLPHDEYIVIWYDMIWVLNSVNRDMVVPPAIIPHRISYNTMTEESQEKLFNAGVEFALRNEYFKHRKIPNLSKTDINEEQRLYNFWINLATENDFAVFREYNRPRILELAKVTQLPIVKTHEPESTRISHLLDVD